MHKNTSLARDIRRRLLHAGFSRTYANRTAREVQEHWDEVAEDGIRHGLIETDAINEASKRLGTAEALAKELSERLQRSSWLGRHPTLAFSLLALMLTLIWWATLGGAAAGVSGVLGWIITDGGAPPKTDSFSLCVDWIRNTSYITVPWLCCYIAERFSCGWRPALWACLVVAIHNSTHNFTVNDSPGGHGNVYWGYSLSFGGPALLPIIAPLAVFTICYFWRIRRENDDAENSSLKSA